MPDLIGEPIPGYVSDQIKIRQLVHGLYDRDKNPISSSPVNYLPYLNSRNSWVKLASGTSIDEERLKQINLVGKNGSRAQLPISDNKGSDFAKNFVLFNGISQYRGSGNDSGYLSPLSRAVGYGFNSTYGFASSQDSFGLTAMPGIKSMSVSALNRGSIKKASLKIIAFNSRQLDIIDALYLRLGYTMMLEWGDSHYLDPSGNYAPLGNTLIENKFFTSNDGNYINWLKDIEDYRTKYQGCYDGFFGRVTNYSWDYNEDGSYDITLDMHTHGDVVESLNIKAPNVSKVSSNLTPSQLPDTEWFDSVKTNLFEGIISPDVTFNISTNNSSKNYVQLSNSKNRLATFLHLIQLSGKYLFNTSTTDGLRISIDNRGLNPKDQKIYVVNTSLGFSGDGILETNKNNVGCQLIDENIVYIHHQNFGTIGSSYIRLGTLLKFLDKKIIPKIKTKDTPSLVRINYGYKIGTSPQNEVENDDVFKAFTTSNHIPLDPSICIFQQPNFRPFSGDPFRDKERKTHAYEGLKDCAMNNEYLKTMNIYLNVDNLLDKVKSSSKLNLYDFLESVCSDLNKALGSINNFEVVVDNDTNILKILDSTKIPGVIAPQNVEPLVVYGYSGINNKNVSTFVRKLDLKTQITKEYATMITIGATAGGNSPGEEATAFSKWNIGIVDRFNPEIIDPNGVAGTPPTPTEKLWEWLQAYYLGGYGYPLGLLYNFIGTVREGDFPLPPVSSLFDETTITNNIKYFSDYYQTQLAKRYANGKGTSSPSVGFLPFGINVTLDGLSGFKIYNKLEVDTRFLPSNYPESLEFIITGVEHNVEGNDWTTEIKTLAVPLSAKFIDPNINAPTTNPQNNPPTPTSPATTSTTAVTGEDADFWALLAVCALEDSDPQGRADVAQTIYNRLNAYYPKKDKITRQKIPNTKGSKAYSGNSLKEIIVYRSSYQPAYDKSIPSRLSNGRPNPAYGTIHPTWKAIKDKPTAIAALKYTKGSSYDAEKALKDTWNALKDISLQNASKTFIEGRTDFLSESQGSPAQRNAGHPERRAIMRSIGRGGRETNNVFTWAYNYNLITAFNTVAEPPLASFFNKYKNQF